VMPWGIVMQPSGYSLDRLRDDAEFILMTLRGTQSLR